MFLSGGVSCLSPFRIAVQKNAACDMYRQTGMCFSDEMILKEVEELDKFRRKTGRSTDKMSTEKSTVSPFFDQPRRRTVVSNDGRDGVKVSSSKIFEELVESARRTKKRKVPRTEEEKMDGGT